MGNHGRLGRIQRICCRSKDIARAFAVGFLTCQEYKKRSIPLLSNAEFLLTEYLSKVFRQVLQLNHNNNNNQTTQTIPPPACVSQPSSPVSPWPPQLSHKHLTRPRITSQEVSTLVPQKDLHHQNAFEKAWNKISDYYSPATDTVRMPGETDRHLCWRQCKTQEMWCKETHYGIPWFGW